MPEKPQLCRTFFAGYTCRLNWLYQELNSDKKKVTLYIEKSEILWQNLHLHTH